MSPVEDQLRREQIRLCYLIDRALYERILEAGIVPDGINIDALAARILMGNAEQAHSVFAWVAIAAVAIMSWRRKWTVCLESGQYMRALRTTWLSVRAFYSVIRLARASERHIIFQLEEMFALVAG